MFIRGDKGIYILLQQGKGLGVSIKDGRMLLKQVFKCDSGFAQLTHSPPTSFTPFTHDVNGYKAIDRAK